MLRSRFRGKPEPAPTATSVAFEDEVDEVVVYCDRTEQMHCLDHCASLIWALCDGTRDIDGITADLSTLVGLDSEILRSDVEGAIARFRELGILR